MPTADPNWTRLAANFAAWLATYAVHSTLLLGGAWILGRRLAGRRLALEEAAWKLALVGGLLTASLQIGLGVRPIGGTWALGTEAVGPAPAQSLETARTDTTLSATNADAVGATRLGTAVPPRLAAPRAHALPPATAPAAAAAARRSAEVRAAVVLRALAVLALIGGLLALVPLGLAHLRLARRLRARTAIDDGPLPGFLRRLERAAGRGRPARLSSTPRLATPIARGVARGEICLPARALRELTPAEQEGVVAHELAHLARRDPAWMLAARALERLLFVQPLNRLARRRLVEIAEFRCDDWAAGHTGRPFDLARCLTEVAGWSVPGAAPLPVPGIAAGSSLARRVRRLLERPAAAERTPRWLAPLGAAALALVAVAAPGVSRGAVAYSAPSTELADLVDGGGAGSPEAPATAPAAEAPPSPAARPAIVTRPAVQVAPTVATRVRPVVRVAVAAPGEPGAEQVGGAAGPADREDEAEAMIEEEIERGFDAYGDEIERALAPLEDLDEQLEPLEEELDRHFDALGEDFEVQMEALGEQMEALGEQMAALHAEHGEAFATGFDPIGPELEAAMERLGDEMTVLGEKLGALVEKSVDPGLHERIAALVQQAVPSPETLDKIRAEAERLSAEARRLADEHKLTEAERERLRLEARAVADLARPDAARLAELSEQARKLAEEARPSAADLEALRSELEARLPEIRARQREAIERQREALDRQREALERERERLEEDSEPKPAAEAPATPHR